jgi:hypothetical protein
MYFLLMAKSFFRMASILYSPIAACFGTNRSMLQIQEHFIQDDMLKLLD